MVKKLEDTKEYKKLINLKQEEEKELNEKKYKVLNLYANQVSDKINNIKTKNLRSIYEIIYNNCFKITDIEHIEKFGISTHIKEKLILPTCYIIKERDLEFTFHNFCIISNEILRFLL